VETATEWGRSEADIDQLTLKSKYSVWGELTEKLTGKPVPDSRC
jgi:hypothetical protein